MVPVTEHCKKEWSRFATAAYAIGRNDVGHRFSAAAALPHYCMLPEWKFDSLQCEYRAWLCFNQFPANVEIISEPSISEQRAMGIHFGYEKL